MLPPSDAPFIGWDWDVVHDADLNDALPPLWYNGAPINLTGCGLAVFIRPTLDNTAYIAVLDSTHITINDAPNGLVTVFVPQATVESWPIGEWEFFMRVTDGTKFAEVARGPFRVHAGNDTFA